MRRAWFASLAVAAAVAGCGSEEERSASTPTPTSTPRSGTPIDARKAERFIATTVRDQVGAEVDRVECPDGLTAERGATFDCTVFGTDETAAPVEIYEKDNRGNIRLDAPLLHVRNLERIIGDGIAKQIGHRAKVSCPEIIVGRKGGRLTCEVVSGSDRAKVDVTQTDDQGNVDYKVRQ